MKKLLTLLIFTLSISVIYGQEICDNGIDDDADGLIDLNDSDCDCNGLGGVPQTVTSLIPNPSFEDNSCCPSSVSQLYCADGWVQASNPTSDYFNTCGYTSIFNDPQFPLPGGGAGYAGFYSFPNWEENIGSCLNSPMLAGQQYTLNLNTAWSNGSTVFDLTIYATPNCADLPWNTNSCAVGSGSWFELGSQTVNFNTNGAWENVTITFTPTMDINAISIGGPCGGQTTGYNYYFVDELTLALTSAFTPGNIVETGGWCSNDLMLDATTDTSGGTWQWYMDGIALVGETDSLIDVMPYGPGDYSAVYTVGGECERSDYTVSIPDAPVSDYTVVEDCEYNTINFTDNSTITTGTITNWDWDFDDGNTSTTQSPSNLYTNPGTYDVSLTTTSSSGCTNTFTMPVTVYPEPVADFSFAINGNSSTGGLTGGCLNDVVDFSDAGNVPAPDNIIGYQWDFGDANTSTSQNPSHQYATDGTYTVELITETNNGCFDTITMPVDMFPSPVADFTIPGVCMNLASDFTDISTISSGTITNWEWDFDDTNTSTNQNPANTYASNGQYNVELIVTSDQGCTDTTTLPADVYELPVADFTPTGVCDYEDADFADMSTITTGAITGWSWDFGDMSGTSTTQNPQYNYGTAGNYLAELLVSSDNGCLDSITIPIDIFGTPTADFSFTDDCYYNLASFNDLSTVSSGTINIWAWDFGDGNTSNSTSPTHQYMADGTYDVELIVTSGLNCIDTINQTITRHPKPFASFICPDVCSYDLADFTDMTGINAPGIISQWDWNFGDSNTDNIASPSHQYASDGSYDITLTTTSADGCVDDTTITVVIYPIPVASFTAGDVCVNTPPMYFNESSTIASGTVSSWDWSFGNGTTSALQNPVNNYGVDGTFITELIVTSDFGCKDTITNNVNVLEKPIAAFTSDIVTACNPECIQFMDLSTSATTNITGWEWDFNNGQTLTDMDPQACYNHSFDATVYYDVNLIAENSFGCKDTTFTDDYISIVPMPVASFAFNPQDPDVWESDVLFTNTSMLADSYYWEFGDGGNSMVENPYNQYPAEPASYNIMLVASSANGICVDTAVGFITVDDVIVFHVPNVFTPDGDDYNEAFTPIFYSGYDPFDYHLMIFNRWGEIMFESYDVTQGWDGTYSDGGLVEDGVYIWTIEFSESMTDKRHKHNGHVTVLK